MKTKPDYNEYHRDRLNFLTVLVKDIIKPRTLLEIAPCEYTFNLRFLGNAHTMGLKSALSQWDKLENHTEYNFCNIQHHDTWPDLPVNWCKGGHGQFHLVVACEIIEHLPVDMLDVFKFFNRYLRYSGQLLIQTPNAAALKKRVPLMLGRNPYDLIHLYPNGYGHIREYTIKELITFGEKTGFRVSKVWCKNYFLYTSAKGKAYKKFCDMLPKTFHDGITILFNKIS